MLWPYAGLAATWWGYSFVAAGVQADLDYDELAAKDNSKEQDDKCFQPVTDVVRNNLLYILNTHPPTKYLTLQDQ